VILDVVIGNFVTIAIIVVVCNVIDALAEMGRDLCRFVKWSWSKVVHWNASRK
jgi:hypothetical protein